MGERICAGLPADWLNGWLAALGALVLCPDLRLSWSDEPIPMAALSSPDDDPLEQLARAWPSTDDLEEMPVARIIAGRQPLEGKPTVDEWQDRAQLARRHHHGWTLSSFYTDLVWDQAVKDQVVRGGAFNAPAPGPVGTVHDRLLRVASMAEAQDLEAALDGGGPRVNAFGLGFDITRMVPRADGSSGRVSPHIELLAYFGLAFFPVRGTGSARTHRGWSERPERFRWWTWRPQLAAPAVDALLDAAATRGTRRSALGITGGFESVTYSAPGKEQAIGLGARPLHGG